MAYFREIKRVWDAITQLTKEVEIINKCMVGDIELNFRDPLSSMRINGY